MRLSLFTRFKSLSRRSKFAATLVQWMGCRVYSYCMPMCPLALFISLLLGVCVRTVCYESHGPTCIYAVTVLVLAAMFEGPYGHVSPLFRTRAGGITVRL